MTRKIGPVAVELVCQSAPELYDSIESNGFLFSDEVDSVDEDEYAIISECDGDDDDIKRRMEEGEETIVLQRLEGEETFVPNDVQSRAMEWDIHSGNKDVKTQVLNKRKLSEDLAYKNSTGNSKLENDGEVIDPKSEPDSDDEKLFSFENTAEPNRDYEMKIIAESNDDVKELSLSNDDWEIDMKGMGWKGQGKSSGFKLKKLSNRKKQPFKDLGDIPLEEFRNLEGKETVMYVNNNKMPYSFPSKHISISALNLKPVGVFPVATTQNITPLTTSTINTTKNVKSVSDIDDIPLKSSISCIIPQRVFDLRMLSLGNRNLRINRVHSNKNSKRYEEFGCKISASKPVEMEMKIMNANAHLSNATVIVDPRKTRRVPRKFEISRHYISFYKQKNFCKYVNVAFVDIGKTEEKIHFNQLDVPFEEVIEEVYTHVIDEVIIYEDETITSYTDLHSLYPS